MVRFEKSVYLESDVPETKQAGGYKKVHPIIPQIREAKEIHILINSTLKKLWFLLDKVFLNLDWKWYKEQ